MVDTNATEAQFKFVKALLCDKNVTSLPDNYVARITEILKGEGAPLTKRGASKLIDTLLALPNHETPLTPADGATYNVIEYGDPFAEPTSTPNQAVTVAPSVPEGRYALRSGDGIHFYKVDAPTEGRWAGYVFVKLLASDDEIRIGKDRRDKVLAEITLDPKAASILYGHEIGRCGMCGRTLTNAASREAGIGPICASKAGW